MPYSLRFNINFKNHFFRTKQTLQKMHSFFFRELQLIKVLFLMGHSSVSWNTRLCGIIFDSVLFLLKFGFLFNKSMDSLTLKRHSSFQNYNNRKITHPFAHRPLIFKLQKEVVKRNDIFVSSSSLKTDLKMNFSNLENWKFENVSFSQ